jgi:hypothetical protein
MSCCPFCNITVAPADPQRLEYCGHTAHEGCFNNRGLKEALVTASYLLNDEMPSDAVSPATLADIRGNKITNRRQLISALTECLASINCGSLTRRKFNQLCGFMDAMSDKLYVNLHLLTDEVRAVRQRCARLQTK